MGLFTKKPLPTIFSQLNFDLKQFPDDSFILNEEESNDDVKVYYKLFPEKIQLGFVDKIEVMCFTKSPTKNYVLRCVDTSALYQRDLIIFFNKFANIYGKDDYGKSKYDSKDARSLNIGIQISRRWSKKTPETFSIDYDDIDGLCLTIWG